MPKRVKTAKKAYSEGTNEQFDAAEMRLGPWTSYSLVHDPKHLGFVLARYKFCAKLLEGKKAVLEVGSGDGFGLPVMAQSCGRIYAVDWDPRLLSSNAERLKHLRNISYLHCDLNHSAPKICVDAAYLIDVIEHIEPANEARFMRNIVRCLKPEGVMIVGTPNKTAAKYATRRSRVQHINLKEMSALRALMEKHFENVFMFGMNDEVVHLGYAPMCHYIWAVGAGLKQRKRT
jgi:2-polyprenyl-3-methyl-5-hydroxy-6-metoxy-1,4-benzoquinol methylase